jgi:hypothetical protein
MFTVRVFCLWSRTGLELIKQQENPGFLSYLSNSMFEGHPEGEEQNANIQHGSR